MRVATAVMAVAALASCNKEGVVEIEPAPEPVLPPEQFDGVKVYEYTPAPGQFINEPAAGAEALATAAQAAAWAQERINGGLYVSLGAFGGYIVMGLDHSIKPSGAEYDFYIASNAFLSASGSSNEPGIVWVMPDDNGNHLPDDTWYELAGSDSDNPTTRHNFSVTYRRPDAPKSDTDWTDSDGNTGVVKYVAPFHSQDYYYPAWIAEGEYTLTGTLLSANNSLNPSTGFWNNAPYGWGYADNVGSDNLTESATASTGQRTGFRIANATTADGVRISLSSIDFVKVQTGVLATSGALGEISTEVCGFGEYTDE